MSLKTLKIIFVILGAVYFLSPYDLLPDFFGIFGRLDDLFVAGLLYWKYQAIKTGFFDKIRSRLQSEFQEEKSNSSEKKSSEYQANTENEKAKTFDPYHVLQLEKPASKTQIKRQYRKLIADYHPDKVAHLGEELQAFAEHKTLELNRAYELLA